MALFRRIQGRHAAVLCAVGGVPFLAFPTVSAEECDRRVKISDLPIYSDEKAKPKYRYEEPPSSPYRVSINACREALSGNFDAIRDATSKVTSKFLFAKSSTTAALRYVQEEPGILPKAGVITVAGLGGIIAGYRGGLFRKFFLSTFAMGSATALCYPHESIALTTQSYHYACSLVKGMTQKNECDSVNSVKVIPDAPPTECNNSATLDEKKMDLVDCKGSLEDHGQSKPEDKDMYTRRG